MTEQPLTPSPLVVIPEWVDDEPRPDPKAEHLFELDRDPMVRAMQCRCGLPGHDELHQFPWQLEGKKKG